MSKLIELDPLHIRRYMRLAKQVGEDNNPCYSRHIGSVIVNPLIHKVVGTGYNGPARDTPHCVERVYLEEIFWPQLNPGEKEILHKKVYEGDVVIKEDQQFCSDFLDKYTGCKTCPRRLIDAKSGEKLEKCSCCHSETNAIVNASDILYGCYIFCWCPVPCWECSKLIINSGIKRVYCLKVEKDYSFGSRWLLRKGGVEIIEHDEQYCTQD